MALIAIDGVKLSNKPCGLSNIALSIINAITADNEHQVVVVMRSAPHPEIDIELKKNSRVKLVISPPFIFKNISIFWSLFYVNRIVKCLNADLFIAPNFLLSPFFPNRKIKTCVFVHDLVIKDFPETMHWFNRLHMMLLFKYSLKKSNIIWCNSNYTLNQLMRYYGPTVQNKILFAGSGINQYFLEQSKLVDKQLNVSSKPYILFVGSVEPRKNILFLLNLYTQLYKRYELVMVGSHGWGKTNNEVKAFLEANAYLNEHITSYSNIPTSKLVSLYKNAEFLISTSLNEGLGLPLLEAMACSCPVLAPHNSAYIEILADTGITVKSWVVEDWLQAIDDLNRERDIHIEKGLNKVKKYHWSSIIKNFLKVVNLKDK